MNYDHYGDRSAALALDFINDYATAPRAAAGVSHEPLPDLRVFLRSRHMPGDDVGPGDEAEAPRLADRLHAVFTAEDDAGAVAAINAVLADYDATPQVSAHDGDDWHLHYHPAAAGPLDRLAVIAAMGLATVVCTGGTRRLGRCDADDCRDVYVDTSRNNRRRFCGDTCANRSHVAAHRARRRADG